MFFNKLNFSKLILWLSILCLVACATKQPVQEMDKTRQAETLQLQQEEQFKQALGLMQTENVQEKDLLKAKEILDALYKANTAYLGALINSADISMTLNKLDEAKSLYLDALHAIEKKQGISENNTIFSIHSYNQLGLIERQQGHFDQAEAYYRHALDLNSENPITLKNLAILLDLYKGKLAEALVLYEKYQSLVGESDPKIKDWIFDLKNRLPVDEIPADETLKKEAASNE